MPESELPPLALAYHGVAEVPLRRDPHALFVPPRALLRHLSILRGWGYRLVAFRELAALASEGRAAGHASITFDDGLADNLHALRPLLETAAAPATVFVTSGWLGEPHPTAAGARILTADEVRKLGAGGVEIGAHSHTHRDLTSLPPGDQEDELVRSRELLEEIVQRPVESLAYPYGRADDQVRAACRSAGYRAACRASGQGIWSDPFDLPRQSMGGRDSAIGLRLKRDGSYERIVARLPFRAARRIRRGTLALLGR
jgi:peptidoglycan/xylan/chitin deacetylase (PgdA/CDA1 family)